LGDCDYDAAGELLRHLYPDLGGPGEAVAEHLVGADLPGAEAAGLGPSVYLYVPGACQDAPGACDLHLVLHGCAQSRQQLGLEFIQSSGYLPWAEGNAMVLAFPQVVPSAVNPYACWDWWGYTGADYRWRDGAQMRVLADWVRDFTGQ
jgi:poly(3-hydroxybutyrate) depolymerase